MGLAVRCWGTGRQQKVARVGGMKRWSEATPQASSEPANRTVSGSVPCFGKVSLAGDEGPGE